MLGRIFGWTSGATIGTFFTIAKRGEHVGTDEFGNRYYLSRDSSSYDGRRRRWVTYNGYADASKVPPDWHGWLHYTYDELPTENPLPRKAWEEAHLPNLSGTPMAWRPKGSLAVDGKRPAATGDYEALAAGMTLRVAILAGITALTLVTAGAVVASALNDLPQDAVPVRDPTSVLNTQPAVPPPPPVEPAPEGEPAPAAPVAVTPPAPAIVVAEDDLTDEDEVEDEAEPLPVKAVETPVEPSRRQRRRVAIVEAIDKITAESMRFEVEVGGRPVRFKRSLIFTARACEVSAPDEQVTDAVAYLEVAVQPRGILRSNDPRQIFRGWMFASSPAINGLQHPVYDAWVVGCKA